MEWKKESNYIIHESGFTIIIEEGSFNEPSTIRIKQSERFDAIEQAKLLREGMKFGRLDTHVDRKRMAPKKDKAPRMTVINTYKTLIPEMASVEKKTPKITVKKTRKIRIPEADDSKPVIPD